ncbi:Peroxisomal membrane associated protein 20 [Vanrija pseudolonga]|uniref:Peroxisomal membrane associated protein 20 n=1 Tax=Vanrija pseudolonga TaxID=143232 RepID=A0AAF0Y610_9TREE|nr:Peroxisomal membrane associated protein 20 [Vanrija pseudolonga]
MSLATTTTRRLALTGTRSLRTALSLRSAHTLVNTAPRFIAPRRAHIHFPKMAAPSASLSTAAKPEIKAGDKFPSVAVRTKDFNTTVDFSTLPGKNIIVTVPGAFTATCHSQVPGYFELYQEFKGKGVNEIYVVSVNDLFVVNAWKDNHLEQSGLKEDEAPKFAADDKAELANALGLELDARGGLGSIRLKRTVIVVQDGKVVSATVEPDSGKSTVTQADNLIKTL